MNTPPISDSSMNLDARHWTEKIFIVFAMLVLAVAGLVSNLFAFEDFAFEEDARIQQVVRWTTTIISCICTMALANIAESDSFPLECICSWYRKGFFDRNIGVARVYTGGLYIH